MVWQKKLLRAGEETRQSLQTRLSGFGPTAERGVKLEPTLAKAHGNEERSSKSGWQGGGRQVGERQVSQGRVLQTH